MTFLCDNNSKSYTSDRHQIIEEEYGGGSQPIHSYIWDAGIDRLLAVTVHPGTQNEAVYYAITDRLGSVCYFADAAGAIKAGYYYDVWGQILSSYCRVPELEDVPTRWQGREYSPTSGFYYFRNRWYDPVSSRFLSPDPIGFAGGQLNLYAFCGNDPLNYRDPYGEWIWHAIGAAIGAGVDLFSQTVIQQKSFSEINWVSVGASAITGALGSGLSVNLAKNASLSISKRALYNGVGNAAIGGGVKIAQNALENKQLSSDVGTTAIVNGGLGALGSLAGDFTRLKFTEYAQPTELGRRFVEGGTLLPPNKPYLLPGEIPTPTIGSILGDAVGYPISNLGSILLGNKKGTCE